MLFKAGELLCVMIHLRVIIVVKMLGKQIMWLMHSLLSSDISEHMKASDKQINNKFQIFTSAIEFKPEAC